MADVKWIKIVVDIFDDDKIKLIEVLPDGDSIIVCWFKLLCLAGMKNNYGVLMLNERIAYTDEMLATIFRRPLQTVRLALETFEAFGMIEIINGAITIPNWEKHQNAEKMEALREYNREAQQKSRAKRKMLTAVNDNVNDKSMTSQLCQDTDIDVEIDTDIEVETEQPPRPSKSDIDRVVEAWNSLGLSKVTKIPAGSDRYNLLNKRLKDFGVDAVLQAIENIRQSSFLNGNNSKGWFISFDWFIKPNNFPKVLDGNYADSKPQQQPVANKKKYSTGETYKPPVPTAGTQEDLMKRLQGLVDQI